MTRSDFVIAGLLVLLGWVANSAGLLVNALFVFLLVAALAGAIALIWQACRGGLDLRLWQTPRSAELRGLRRQIVGRWVFWLISAVTVRACLIPAQLSPDGIQAVNLLLWAATGLLLVLELFPAKRLHFATNLAFAIGSIFLGAQTLLRIWPVSAANAVVLAPPFRGEWIVVQGGRTSLINHHYGLKAQRFAIDFSKIVNGQVCVGSAADRESYPSWNEILSAPADGTVVEVTNHLPDNTLKSTDPKHPVGNHVTIDLGKGRFVLLAHLQQGSVSVARGDRVQAGQPIAKCGNSGNTTQPHLHLQVQNRADFSAADLETFPILFRDLTCLRGDQPRVDAPFFVRRNDRLIHN